MFRATLNTSTFQNITQIVRILLPPRVWIVARPGHARSQCFGDPARLEKRLDFGCATRNTTPYDAMHRVARALQNSKGTGQKCEKA